jgi:prepilin-type processing-associated H-X9-DG protein
MPERIFAKEDQVRRPSHTPLFADGIHYWWVWPQATDLPATNLKTGQNGSGFNYGMAMLTIPRHGSIPNRVSTEHRPEQPLPGGINVVFYDGHAETVRLEGLWQLEWHRGYKPPSKRPGRL